MRKTIVLQDWRRRVMKARARGSFTKKDVDDICMSPCNCIKGELASILGFNPNNDPYIKVGKTYPLTDDLEYLMKNAVSSNDFSSAEKIIEMMERVPRMYQK